MLRKTLCFLFLLLLVLNVRAGVLSGAAGATSVYEFDTETHELTISGTGEVTTRFWDFERGNKSKAQLERMIFSVVIQDGVTAIGNGVFDNCASIESITIPQSVASIGSNCFSSNKMSRLYIPSIAWWCHLSLSDGGSVPFYGSNVDTHVYVEASGGYSEVTNLVIPSGVSEISANRFFCFNSILTVDLADVTSIGQYAFSGCTALNEVAIKNKCTMVQGSFANCNSLTKMTLRGEAMSSIYVTTFPAAVKEQLHVSVPAHLLSDYLNNKFWGTYKFHALEDNASTFAFAKTDDGQSDNLIYQDNGRWLCRSLVVEDGKSFLAPVDFVAETATYNRGVGNEWGTLCLPFAVTASDEVSFYTQGVISDDVLTLTSTETLEPGQPAIYNICSGRPLSFTASNVAISASLSPAMISSGIELVGTFDKIKVSNPNAYYIKSNQFWRRADADGSSFNVSPYRAYFTTTAVGSPTFSIAIDPEDPAGLSSLVGGYGEVTAYYDVAGNKRQSPMKGLNVVKFRNGKSSKMYIK